MPCFFAPRVRTRTELQGLDRARFRFCNFFHGKLEQNARSLEHHGGNKNTKCVFKRESDFPRFSEVRIQGRFNALHVTYNIATDACRAAHAMTVCSASWRRRSQPYQ